MMSATVGSTVSIKAARALSSGWTIRANLLAFAIGPDTWFRRGRRSAASYLCHRRRRLYVTARSSRCTSRLDPLRDADDLGFVVLEVDHERGGQEERRIATDRETDE